MTAPFNELDRLDDAALADRLQGAGQRIASELRKVIVGQDAVVEQAGPVLAERGERRLRAERRQWPRPAGAALAATLGSNRRPFRAGR